MRTMSKILFLAFAASLLAPGLYGQEPPSLGDAARQARQQKQQQQKDQPKDSQAKGAPGAKTAKVVTNDEIPAHIVPVSRRPSASVDGSVGHAESDGQPSSSGAKLPADQWKAQILSLKN